MRTEMHNFAITVGAASISFLDLQLENYICISDFFDHLFNGPETELMVIFAV